MHNSFPDWTWRYKDLLWLAWGVGRGFGGSPNSTIHKQVQRTTYNKQQKSLRAEENVVGIVTRCFSEAKQSLEGDTEYSLNTATKWQSSTVRTLPSFTVFYLCSRQDFKTCLSETEGNRETEGGGTDWPAPPHPVTISIHRRREALWPYFSLYVPPAWVGRQLGLSFLFLCLPPPPPSLPPHARMQLHTRARAGRRDERG